MQKLHLVFIFIIAVTSCKKSKDSNNQRTLQVTVKDYQPPGISNHYWGIYLTFNPQVTTSGTVKVQYDVYDLGALYKHYSYKFPFSINNENTFIYNTLEGSQLMGPEIRNIKIDSLQASGDYAITIK